VEDNGKQNGQEKRVTEEERNKQHTSTEQHQQKKQKTASSHNEVAAATMTVFDELRAEMEEFKQEQEAMLKEINRKNNESMKRPSHPVEVVAVSSRKYTESVSILSSRDYDGTVSSYRAFQKKDLEKRMTQSLKNYIRSNLYSMMKFSVASREAKICILAVNSGAILIPDKTTVNEFAEYYKKKVPQIFNQLRHNTQSLARRNWIGENILKLLVTFPAV